MHHFIHTIRKPKAFISFIINIVNKKQLHTYASNEIESRNKKYLTINVAYTKLSSSMNIMLNFNHEYHLNSLYFRGELLDTQQPKGKLKKNTDAQWNVEHALT